jgi:hypothetical protein
MLHSHRRLLPRDRPAASPSHIVAHRGPQLPGLCHCLPPLGRRGITITGIGGVAALYHERWELELGFDELKTHTLEREEALRSKRPARIVQEVFGLAIGYNLVRLAMTRVAARARVPPGRISYRHALQFIRLFWLTAWTASPGVLPRRLEALHDEPALLILPERRPQRRYPRAVKLKMSNYPRNRPRRRRIRVK